MENRSNNFDLIRIFAAIQVVVFHLVEHFHIKPSAPWSQTLLTVYGWFPGVPIFFAISGFLVSASWERKPVLAAYLRNRALRIFPGLWVCLLVTIVALLLFRQSIPLLWVLAQLTIGQAWTPDSMRSYGVGSPNGSLWTIPVELQFYAIVPCIYLMSKAKQFNVVLGILCAASIAASFAYPDSKAIHATFIPYVWMFLLGVLIQRNIERIKPIIQGKGLLLIVGYIGLGFLLTSIPGITAPQAIALPVLALVIVSCAFTMPGLSEKLLKGVDLSYGIYLYHLVIINILVTFKWQGWEAVSVTLIATLALASMSWFFVEKPCQSFRAKLAL